jgi:hypothetical protein
LFKKAGIIALATASLLMAGGPAFADPYYVPTGADSNEQLGAVNTGDIDIVDTLTVPVCLSDTNVSVGILVAVVADILSPSGQADSCDVQIANENGDR